jgi:hypothetical protein
MPELFVRRLYCPGFARHFYGFVVAGWLGLSLASVAGCATRVDDVSMPVAPTSPISMMEAADLSLAPPPAQKDAQPQSTQDAQAITGVDQKIQRAIQDATDAVGTDSTYLMVVAARESSFDPQKRAYRTSATGLYQFTTKTWLRSVRAFGERHGLGEYAKEIVVDEHGAVSMRNAAARAKLLRLRADPRISALMAAELARDNEARLIHKLGRPVTPAEIYMAHLLGVNEAARVIAIARSAPQTPGARLLPAAARANPDLFKPRGRIASAKAIVSKIGVHYQREELRFVQQIRTNGGRAPAGTNFPDTLRGWPSGDMGPVSRSSLSLASVAP